MTLILISALLSVLSVWWVYRLAPHIGLLDQPNTRSSHAQPTPRGGGLGMALAACGAGAWLGLDAALLLALLAITLLGFWDDLYSLAPTVRFAAQAGIVTAWLMYGSWAPSLILIFVAGFLALWWINLFNFMDGLDGLAASEALFMLCAAALIGHLLHPDLWAHSPIASWGLALAGAVLGFLWHNWPPARIFMGDAGSLFLGLSLFLMAVVASDEGWLHLPAWLVLGALFICDASVTLLRRLLARMPWWCAHRNHAYQHLARRWKSHRRVVIAATSINGLILLPLAFFTEQYPNYAWVTVCCTYLIVSLAALRLGAGMSDHA